MKDIEQSQDLNTCMSCKKSGSIEKTNLVNYDFLNRDIVFEKGDLYICHSCGEMTIPLQAAVAFSKLNKRLTENYKNSEFN